MKPQSHERKSTERRGNGARRQFQIEMLEERIAPAKGGIPGPPTGYEPPGQNYCHTHRHNRAC